MFRKGVFAVMFSWEENVQKLHFGKFSGNAQKMVFVLIPTRIFQFKRITLMKTRYVLT